MNKKSLKLLFVIIFLSMGLLSAEARRKPVIGIAPGYSGANSSIVNRSYTDAVYRAGGIPVILPQVNDEAAAAEILSRLDGVLFTGGVDINPEYYGETVLNDSVEIDGHRDTLDVTYARTALGLRLPILAICRGEQMMNVVLGGSLYQDLPAQKPSEIAHRQSPSLTQATQKISVTKGSMLHRIMGKDVLEVNSAHHQGIKVLGEGLIASAFSEDGIIEAFESPNGPFFCAVQWHPEWLYPSVDATALFREFVETCRRSSDEL